MGYDNDPYRDEDGEPLMDYDDREEERSPQPLNDDDLILDPEEDVRDFLRSQTPVHDDDVDEGSRSKPRKRLVKKSDRGGKGGGSGMLGLEDEDDDVAEEREEEYGGGSENRKRKEKSRGGEKRRDRGDGGKRFKGGGDRRRGEHHDGGDAEVKEMWDTIAGGDSEDDREAPRTMDDDNFIDDSGVDPADRYGNDDNRSPSHYPQAEEGEEDDEIKNLFKMGKKKKKNERSAAEVALLVENVMAELEVTAEEDAELNRLSKPAVNKLKKLPLLTEVLAKKQLQQEFLDHGVLNLLRTWLEPLPDGSLPNTNIRAAILRILTDFPIDLEQYDRREQLKKSGLGKVIMFLSKSSEETTSNRKLAKDLVDKWSRPIFNKSTRFEDMRNIEDERNLYRRPSVKKPSNRSGGMESRDDDLDMPKSSQDSKSGGSSSMSHASRPEAMSLDFIVRPQSKIDPDEVRARAKQVVQDQRRMKMNKKMQQMKAPKKKQLQATKLSVEGRGMVKYL